MFMLSWVENEKSFMISVQETKHLTLKIVQQHTQR